MKKKRCANLLALLVVGDSNLHEQKQSFKYDEPFLEEIKHETSWIFLRIKTALLGNLPKRPLPVPCGLRIRAVHSAPGPNMAPNGGTAAVKR